MKVAMEKCEYMKVFPISKFQHEFAFDANSTKDEMPPIHLKSLMTFVNNEREILLSWARFTEHVLQSCGLVSILEPVVAFNLKLIVMENGAKSLNDCDSLFGFESNAKFTFQCLSQLK